MIRGRGALSIEQLTHFEDDDLIAGRVGSLAEFGDGGRRGGRRLIAPAITNESNDVGGHPIRGDECPLLGVKRTLI
jgi:hypothetical protein